jgi:hypothetical protein
MSNVDYIHAAKNGKVYFGQWIDGREQVLYLGRYFDDETLASLEAWAKERGMVFRDAWTRFGLPEQEYPVGMITTLEDGSYDRWMRKRTTPVSSLEKSVLAILPACSAARGSDG